MNKPPESKPEDSPAFKLDDIDRKLLHELQKNGRLSYAELGRRCDRTATAIMERVAQMEAAGVILGYRARVNPKALGMPFKAMIRLSAATDQAEQLTTLVKSRTEISEWYITKGQAGSLFVKAHLVSIESLETLLDLLLPYGTPYASIVLSSPVEEREIEPPSREQLLDADIS